LTHFNASRQSFDVCRNYTSTRYTVQVVLLDTVVTKCLFPVGELSGGRTGTEGFRCEVRLVAGGCGCSA
jgi:hypothetical protein